MGRHHAKLSEHLHLPPPSSSQTSSAFVPPAPSASSFPKRSGPANSSTSFLFHSTSTTRALERRIPGFKTSAALRANIDLQNDGLNSPGDTPDCLRPVGLTSASYLPPPSPLIHPLSHSDFDVNTDLSSFPALRPRAASSPLQTEVDGQLLQPQPQPQLQSQHLNVLPRVTILPATSDALREEALHLVADSVIQQGQTATKALIFSPASILLLASVLGLLRYVCYTGEVSDYAIIVATTVGLAVVLFIIMQAQKGIYNEEAERVGSWHWLAQGRPPNESRGIKVLGGDEDEILLTKLGTECIGTVIYRGVQTIDESTTTRRASRRNSFSLPRTEIRAWTIRDKFRGKGVGRILLEAAIKTATEQGWTEGGVLAAQDHANSKAVLPEIFGGFVQKNNDKTRRYIDRIVEELEERNSNGNHKRRHV